MKYRIELKKKQLKNTLQLPSSKSVSNRLLILNALGEGRGSISNLSDSDDTRVLENALSSRSGTIDIGHAGTAMRFLTAYLCIRPGEYLLTGSDRMKQRPLAKLVEALKSLGAAVSYAGEEGYPPLRIKGTPLEGGEIAVDSSVSSQYISALMMIAPSLKKGIRINLLNEVVSSSYIKLTKSLMEGFGIPVEFSGRHIRIPSYKYRAGNLEAEGDWSAAGYWYSIAALSESVELELGGLSPGSFQGDAVIPELFRPLGVSTTERGSGVLLQRIRRSAERFDFDFVDCPDQVQTMVVACALLDLPFRMTGTRTLKIKETDRISALQREMAKLGFRLDADPGGNWIEWEGQKADPVQRPEIETYQDHRMAMAFAPASIRFPGLQIMDPAVVNKSYPGFWEDLETAGFSISESAV
jgi:3-phosphoshikimate 1-carboxyvinyltransferase